MIRLFRILFMNAWRGLRSYDGVLTAMALIFASVSVLAIGSKVDAANFQPDSSKTVAGVDAHLRQNDGLALVMKAHGSMQNLSKINHRRPNGDRNADIDKLATVQPSNSIANGSKSTEPSQSAQPVVESVQLSPTQPACQQGQTEVESAEATLQKSLASSTTVTWFWETRIDAGTNASGISPISDTQNSQNLAAGATTISFTADNSSSPLLIAPASSDYAYSFRLHVLIDGVDATSAWVSVPQAASCQ